MKISRRSFVAFAVAAAARTMTPFPAVAGNGCGRPYALGTAIVPWQSPGSGVVKRVNVSVLPSSQLASLRKAYAIMKGLPVSDPRSMEAQRNLHAWYCASCPGVPATDIHQHWTFMPWHRAFLYFHERVLGALAGDPNLRIPYWGWEDPSNDPFPASYGDSSSPLYDASRTLKTGKTVDRALGNQPPYDFSDVAQIIAGDFSFLAGASDSGGNVENGAHGYVHVSTGGAIQIGDPVTGDMSSLNTAARDPIFFAHHGNIDRIWASWQSVNGHTDPTGSFRALSFIFYDPIQKWVTIRCADMIDTRNLGYEYDRTIAPASIPALTPLSLQLGNEGQVLPPAASRQAIARAQTATLNLRGLQFVGEGVFTILLEKGSNRHILGRLFVTPHRWGMRMTRIRRANIRLKVPQSAAQVLASGTAQLTVLSPSVSDHEMHLLQLQFTTPEPARVQHLSISIPQ